MSDKDLARVDRAAFFARLRVVTPARIGLGQTGVSIATTDHLAFQVAHAQARDAVHATLDVDRLLAQLDARRWQALRVRSQATDRADYLARPDRGRRLCPQSLAALDGRAGKCDVAIVIADGLSALAVSSHAMPVLEHLLPALAARKLSWAPIVVAEEARVALGDEIGATLRAKLVCVLIGERPGLSSPDSLGIYLTWAPAVGRTDAERNCLSNVRLAGMSYDDAAARCDWLIGEAHRRSLTGVMLKDDSGALIQTGPSVLPDR